jgi:hypothetical protein
MRDAINRRARQASLDRNYLVAFGFMEADAFLALAFSAPASGVQRRLKLR